MEALVSDAVACGVGPLAGLDAEEQYEVLAHASTLPRHRGGPQGGLLVDLGEMASIFLKYPLAHLYLPQVFLYHWVYFNNYFSLGTYK